MKTKVNPSIKTAATALLVTLFIITVLAVSIGGYLTYVQQQSLLGTRSQTWNVALSVSEAGVEEGLEHLNMNYANLHSDSWSQSGSVYSMTRTLPNGNRYTVTIDATYANTPVITSRAYVNSPTLAYNAPVGFLAAAGTENSTSGKITRAVRVTTGRGSLFLASMVAKHKIDLKGNGIYTDSFDSGDPAKSTNGHYDQSKAGDYGDIASNDGVVSTISVQNANIYGHAYTGPGGTVAIGSQGAIGTHAWQAGHTGIQDGYVLNNANFTFPDTSLPYTSGLTPVAGSIATVSGYVTNVITTVNGSTTPPGTAPSGQFMGPVVTNTSTISTSTYPGAKSGMTTNYTYVTVSAYPGAQPGLTTNYTHFVTTTVNPGSQPALSVTTVTSNVTVRPNPAPSGLSTNTTSVTSSTYPSPGTYVGSVTTNYNGGSHNIKNYTYNQVSGYSYTVTYYTYADAFTYSYLTYVYSYPTTTYSYSLYASTATYTTNSYDHVIGSGDYYVDSSSGLSGKTIITGKARVVIRDGLSMSGTDQIIIADGGSILVYSGGTSITISGNGVINPSGYAGNFIVYCTPTVTSFTLNGNGEFTGVLVAPNANITMNGGGNSNNDFTGALMVSSVNMNGHFSFHYDEALGRMGSSGRYLITKWEEIP